MFGAIASGIASSLAGGLMNKVFGGGKSAPSTGVQGNVLASDNNVIGANDAGIQSAIQGSNPPNGKQAAPNAISGILADTGKDALSSITGAGINKLMERVGLSKDAAYPS